MFNKEAKQLEKVKKLFDDVYKESSTKTNNKEIIYSLHVDENIKQKAEQFKREGYKNFERIKVLDVTPRIKNEIQRLIGFDATGYEIYSNTDTYKHIEYRHGEQGKHDQSMKDMRDVALMGYVLEEFDNAELVMRNGKPDVTYAFSDKNGKPSKLIKFSKEINGTQHVVVATPENKYKKLWVISEYVEQKKDTSQPSHDDKALPPTSETHSDNVSSKDIISENQQKTTENHKKSLSNNDIAPMGSWNVRGKDISLEGAPIRQDVAPAQKQEAAVDDMESWPSDEDLSEGPFTTEDVPEEDMDEQEAAISKKNAERIKNIKANIKGLQMSRDITEKEFDLTNGAKMVYCSTYYGERAAVSYNPDTKELVQVQPKRTK